MDEQIPGVTESVDLAGCDREPIHIPGRIQPHGLLLVLDEPALTIRQASANAAELLSRDASSLIGATVDDAIGADHAEVLRSRLSRESIDENPLYVGTFSVAARSFHAIVHRHAGRLILELERAGAGTLSFANLYALVR